MKLNQIFNLPQENSSKKELLLYLFFAYAVVLAIRLLMLQQIYQTPFMANEVFISPLWAYDSGLYGYYAKELLAGHHYPYISEYIPGYLLYFAVKHLHVTLDNAILFSPPILASLTVLPIVFLGYMYNFLRLSFLMAIVGNITFAYYIRSYIGYYDTDILNVFFSTTIAVMLAISLHKNHLRYFLLALLFSALFYFWYHSSKAIITSLYAIFTIYYLITIKHNFKTNKLFFATLIVALSLAIYFIDFTNTYERALDYFNTNTQLTLQSTNTTLNFKNTLATVDEAQGLKPELYAKFLSLNNIFLAVSLIALTILYILHPSLLMTLPLVILSLSSIKLGTRFSEFATPTIAIGAIYSLVIAKNILTLILRVPILVNTLYVALVGFILHSYMYKVSRLNSDLRANFDTTDVELLKDLNTKTTKNDYILTWWDYGWSLWYFTNASTLIDNGKHHYDNYIISKLLLSPPSYSAKASNYFMSHCSGKGCSLSKKLFKQNLPSKVDETILDYNKKSKKRIYFMFEDKMILMLPTIASFSQNINDPKHKEQKRVIITDYISQYAQDRLYKTKSNITLDIQNKNYTINS
ncbi:MAG: STT3 domain-containing protein, partial [Campylobacterota bacterium]|nr:STT3 domain-containing protein [Campylobacterota bacterium]